MSKGNEKTYGHTEDSGDLGSAIVEYAFFHPERIEDAKFLIGLGMLPIIVSELTMWPRRIVKKLIDKSGLQARSGKPRTSLSHILAKPIYHAALSKYVFALEHQLNFYEEKRLTSRPLVRAVKFCIGSLPPHMANFVDATVYYAIGEEVMQGKIKTATCRHCGACYAWFSPESNLTRNRVFDCPQCRMLEGMRSPAESHLNLRNSIRAKATKSKPSKQIYATIDKVLERDRILMERHEAEMKSDFLQKSA